MGPRALDEAPVAVPDGARLLELWEYGEREHAVDRALTILCAFTGQSRATLAALGVHRRDALLVRCRLAAFGPRLAGVAPCGACGCDIEVELALAPAGPMIEGGTLALGDACVDYRAPNSYDLAAIAACPDAAAAEARLRERCVRSSAPLDERAHAAIDAALEALCEPAAIDVQAACPECAAPFAPPVDIATLLWRELAVYARRLLDEVDVLARRYGWSERDILALPQARRRQYIEIVA